MRVSGNIGRWLTAAVLLAAVSSPAFGQVFGPGALPYQQRYLEDDLRPLAPVEQLTPTPVERLQYDYGAMLRYQALWYEDHGPPTPGIGPLRPFQASRAVHDWDFRPWLAASYDGVHHGFIRGQMDFYQYHHGDSYYHNSAWDGPFVDIGYYRLDVDEAVRRQHCCEVDEWAADVILGRQFLYVGRGISLALPLDAGTFDWQCGPWGGLVFGGRSVEHFDNIDVSVPGFQRSSRNFFGGELEYVAHPWHRLYGYAVVQRDESDETPDVPFQEFDYDSEYWGLGVDGELLFGCPECPVGVPNLRYYSELIWETGRSHAFTSTDRRERIRAWSYFGGLTYYMPVAGVPRLTVEYGRASGDADRRSPNNTIGGNRPFSPDRGFLPFGFVNTGYSFSPLFANLEFVRLGGAVRPWESSCHDSLRQLEIGSSVFFYSRPKDSAGVSDLRADMPGHSYLGTEWDAFVNWRLSSDLYFLMYYGVFWPDSDSFSVDKSRQFASFNLTWLI